MEACSGSLSRWPRSWPISPTRDADPEDAFDHFQEQREINIEYLRHLPSEAVGRVALHQEPGQIARVFGITR